MKRMQGLGERRMHRPLGRAARPAVLGLAAFAAALVVPLTAGASQTFPSEIYSAADMHCVPGCTLCHSTAVGVEGSAVLGTPFGKKMVGLGVSGGNPETLVKAIERLGGAMDPTPDLDGDGKPDLEELKAGTDPSSPDPDASLCGPDYGCGAHVAKTPPRDATPLAFAGVAALLMAFGLRRRR